MGAKMGVPDFIGDYLTNRHGNILLILGDTDWNRIRMVLKKHPKAYKEVTALKVKLSKVLLHRKSYRGGKCRC